MCPDCIGFARLAKQWKVRPKLLDDLVRAGWLSTHEHGERTTITRESVLNCQWHIAMVKADMGEETPDLVGGGD